MCFLDPMHFPALPDDPASSWYWHRTLELRKRFQVPGSNNADAPMRVAYAAGEWPLVDPEDPQPGYYLVRLEPRGPFYPCKIFHTIGCLVNGVYENPQDWWLKACKHAVTKEKYTEVEEWCHEF